MMHYAAHLDRLALARETVAVSRNTRNVAVLRRRLRTMLAKRAGA